MINFMFVEFMIDKGVSVSDLAEALNKRVADTSKLIKSGRIKPKLLHTLLQTYPDAKRYVNHPKHKKESV